MRGEHFAHSEDTNVPCGHGDCGSSTTRLDLQLEPVIHTSSRRVRINFKIVSAQLYCPMCGSVRDLRPELDATATASIT